MENYVPFPGTKEVSIIVSTAPFKMMKDKEQLVINCIFFLTESSREFKSNIRIVPLLKCWINLRRFNRGYFVPSACRTKRSMESNDPTNHDTVKLLNDYITNQIFHPYHAKKHTILFYQDCLCVECVHAICLCPIVLTCSYPFVHEV